MDDRPHRSQAAELERGDHFRQHLGRGLLLLAVDRRSAVNGDDLSRGRARRINRMLTLKAWLAPSISAQNTSAKVPSPSCRAVTISMLRCARALPSVA